MKFWITVVIIFFMAMFQANNCRSSNSEMGTPCSNSGFRLVEEKIKPSDTQDHGPDVGSDEWKSVIEFKLAIRGDPNIPDRDSEAWCRHIDQIVRERTSASSQNDGASNETVMAAGPSYNCNNVGVNSIEEMICSRKQ